ncbi:DUF2087 domain-containing protein [Cohnella herbarum]|uniref:DUF2087 domain-containing protein n=1 Tax=Cohnella herbarum TaxID=2728023 RepID=A0A7Z2VGA7_9BACL|nr:DUF2087 domain-containing protein [Cohnella herbarum]QJD82648.1 DUF2087 domain-containing protein [Cohnella herbarum]
MSISDVFWNSSLEELKQGYVKDSEFFVCLLCGKRTENGIVYPDDGVYYDAEKYMRKHIESSHHSVFDYLIGLDKKLTGLTDHQNGLLRLFHQGKSDGEVQKELGIGSASTIRNHRFVLKEKERQSKVFLALMELLKDKDRHAPAIVNVHKTARMVDERYNVTSEEADKVLKKVFPNGTDANLFTFDLQEKHKLIVLREVAKRFSADRIYTEKEVNEILMTAYEDYAILRRYLIEYGFMDRENDGSRYWLKE